VNIEAVPIRVLVTGVRGKSGVCRLLHAAFSACGFRAYTRITGVLPRELGPEGGRVILRAGPASFREMKWWLARLPPASAQVIIAENSSLRGEYQEALARWVKPAALVWTTLREDHREIWGPGTEAAFEALFRGVPKNTPVICGSELDRREILERFGKNRNAVFFAGGESAADEVFAHHKANIVLALGVCRFFGLDGETAEKACRELKPDIADFRILCGKSGAPSDGRLAAAFSANDIESTRALFAETGWRPEETTLLYHHRSDRGARLKSFMPWIQEYTWKEVAFTGPRIWPAPGKFGSPRIKSAAAFTAWLDAPGRGKVFACGNVAGWPLEYLLLKEGGGT
jgi:hypothetical protein